MDTRSLSAGKAFIFTGSLDHGISREFASQLVRASGGFVRIRVSGRINYVVTGKHSGKKLHQSVKLGVEVLNTEEFLALLERTPTGELIEEKSATKVNKVTGPEEKKSDRKVGKGAGIEEKSAKKVGKGAGIEEKSVKKVLKDATGGERKPATKATTGAGAEEKKSSKKVTKDVRSRPSSKGES